MTPPHNREPRLERLPDVVRRIGLSRAWIYRQLAAGNGFPNPIRLGRSIAWDSRAIDRWISAQTGEV